MARSDADALVLQMSANLARFDKEMRQANVIANRRLNEVEKRALAADRKLSKTMGDAGRNMVSSLKSNLQGLAPVLAGAFSTAAVLKYADAYTALQNRLKAAGLEGAALQKVEDSLYESANRNGVAVEATAELYQRAAMARNNLGASEEQLLALVSGTSAALKLQGTSAGEASGALLQLGQILGGEKVQAQEYNSLIDQLPVLLQAAADGSGRFGGQISTLTAQVKAGKVTTQEFFAALLKGLGDVETRAASATPTVGAAFQTLNNEIGRFVGQTDQGLSATQRLAQGIIALSENLDTVALVVGAVATIMGGRFVLAMTAGSGAMIANGVASLRLAAFQTAMTASMTGTTAATVVATGAMARFNAMLLANPIGAAIIAVAALAAGFVYLSQKYGESAVLQREIASTAKTADDALGKYEEAAKAAAVATGENAAKARENVAAMRTEAITALQSAQALRVRTAALAASRAQEAQEAEARFFSSNGGKGAIEARGGQLALASASARTAERLAADAAKAAADAQTELKRIDDNIATGGYTRGGRSASAGAGSARGTGASGPSPEDLARQRQLLDLQAEIALLRAQDRTAEADAKQDALEVLNLTKQYEEAGFENAQAKAAAQVRALATAREANQSAENAKALAEGEQRAMDLTRGFVLEMLGVQEQIALTDRDSLNVRREILAVRQEERRLALEAAAADAEATEAERNAARDALGQLPSLEKGEIRALEGSSEGARDAQDIAAHLTFYEDAVERAAEAYAEIDRLRQEDLISEQNAALAKSQIDNDLRERRLSGTRTMLDTLATLQNSSNKKLAALGKAAAIAQATIDGVLAVQKALASAPPPFNFIQAAIVGAVAAANVASIAGMADGGLVTGRGGPRDDKELRRLSPGEFVNNAASVRKNRPYLEAANNGADLGKLIPGLANGGMVGRVNAAASRVASVAGQVSSSSMTFAPVIDARGADLAAVRRLESVIDEQARNFEANVNGVRDRRHKYRLGGRRK